MTPPGGTHQLVWLAGYVIVALIAAAPAIGALIVSVRNGKHAVNAAADAAAVRDSVVNDHPRPMRYDIDDLGAAIIAIRGDLSELSDQVTVLDHRTARIGDEVREDRARANQDRAVVAAAVERTETIIAKYHPEDAR